MEERLELEIESMLALGDPRRCPKHPWVKTSSNNGMFDAPCEACEYEIDYETIPGLRKF